MSYSTASTYTGQIKWYSRSKKYGFVTLLGKNGNGKEVLIHQSVIPISDVNFRYLVTGEYVEVELEKSKNPQHEFQVSKVTGIYGGTLMAENHKTRTGKTPVPQQIPIPSSYVSDDRICI